MPDHHQQLAKVLTPCAPPQVIDDVYDEMRFERMFDVVKRDGPWPIIAAHHFDTVDELIATTTGVVPERPRPHPRRHRHPHFRGFLAKNSVLFYPELHDLFYNAKFLELVKGYWRCEYAKPTLMLFNICGPHQAGASAHLDATTFRGVRIENTPVWMQNIMAKSGLFTDYLVKMAQVIAWWYRGEEGTFTYWPDGPLEPPRRLEPPVVEPRRRGAERTHVPPRGRRRPPRRARHRRPQAPLPHGLQRVQDCWEITTDGAAIRTYEPAPDPIPRPLERRGLRRHRRGPQGHGPHRRPHPPDGRRPTPRRHAIEEHRRLRTQRPPPRCGLDPSVDAHLHHRPDHRLDAAA